MFITIDSMNQTFVVPVVHQRAADDVTSLSLPKVFDCILCKAALSPKFRIGFPKSIAKERTLINKSYELFGARKGGT